MTGRARAATAVAAAAALGLVAALPHDDAASFPAAQAFLADHVSSDGRVVRNDEGGDTVSEGQAYALLVAVSLDDEETFDRVWTWTRDNLQRPDGLLAWRWADGTVLDREPAPDADLDAVRALLVAADRFDRPAFRTEALRIAGAVARTVTVDTGGGTYLAAGPWARDQRIVNPSYFAFRTFEQLAAATGDDVWARLTASSRAVVEAVASRGGLVPDWAELDGDGTPRPVPTPGSDATGPRHGLDAARVAFRLADSCDPDLRALAAAPWGVLGGEAEPRAVHDLRGVPTVEWAHPAALVGLAAAAEAAGDRAASARLLGRAADLHAADPTYFGSAWLALSELRLAGRLAPACPDVAGDGGGEP